MIELLLALVCVGLLLQLELHRRKSVKLEDARLIDEQILSLLRSTIAMAESARVSRKETIIAKNSVEEKMETNAAAIKEQVRQVPEKVVEKLKEDDSRELHLRL